MLLYTDRSRREAQFRCPHLRWWEYHSANGFGITRKAQRMPLVTGIYTHKPLEAVCKMVMLGTGEIGLNQGEIALTNVARTQIRAAIKQAQDEYSQVAKAGFYNEPPEELEHQLAEQLCLIEGLAWGWIRTCLPLILAEFDIIGAEQEESFVVGCTCGLGDMKGSPEEHEARLRCAACGWAGDRELIPRSEGAFICPRCGIEDSIEGFKECAGLAYPSRPDLELRRKSDGKQGILDFKTSKYADEREVEAYRSSVQMAAGTVGMERRTGERVEFYYVNFLKKGDRKASYQPDTKKYDGPRRQLSPFCYVDYRPASPPLQREEVRSPSKWYLAASTLDLQPDSKPPEWTLPEWVAWTLPRAEVASQYLMVGPYERQDDLIKRALKQTLHSEREWAGKLWEIHDKVELGDSIQEALDSSLPASWDCNRFGEKCIMWELCHSEVAMEDPLGSGLYELRVPHHQREMEIMREMTR